MGGRAWHGGDRRGAGRLRFWRWPGRHCHLHVIKSVKVAEPDLEAVFLQLTGRALRD